MISFRNSSWFTLIEITIVLTIMMILLWIGLFPYGYYMQRGYTERAADAIGQEWVLAHKAIRWGIEFDTLAETHAHLFFVFETWSSEINSYLLSGSALPDINSLPTSPTILRKYKTLYMENGVKILGFSGSLAGIGNRVWYMISPPNGDGIFFTGTTALHYSGATIIVGYPWASVNTGRSREVLLRTYLK